jgi:asparagine synthase (glutamine-hydrolysing)
MLPARRAAEFYYALSSPCRKPDEWLRDCHDPAVPSWLESFPRLLDQMMYSDAAVYLPDDILVKVDRAAMSTSLETRVPLLDHRVVEFAWSLPNKLKCKGGEGKRILRKVLNRYVPNELVDRPKQGFAVPIVDWLRGSLRPWADALLDESRLRQQGFFNATTVRQRWDEHLQDRRDWSAALWNVLMFEAWVDSETRPTFNTTEPSERPASIVAEEVFS